MRLPRGVREAGLALLTAALVALGFHLFGQESGLAAQLRMLETASLDLRFRLRGVHAPGPETVVVLIDDRSLAALGRWPFSRHILAKALLALDHAGAKVVVFDLLFAEPEVAIPGDVRQSMQAAIASTDLAATPLAGALRKLLDDDPDTELAAAMHDGAKVLLPIAFGFVDAPPGPAADLSSVGYQQFDKSPIAPEFPLRPVSALLPIARLVDAATGLGHAALAYDRDGAPRYDYLALPFEAEFIPSLPVRAVAAFRDLDWSKVALVLGQGVRLDRELIPTDIGMRLLINYRGPRGTFPTYSFLDLVEGRVPEAALRDHLVLLGASFIGNGDSNPAPFSQTPLPGTERMANIVDMLLHRDFLGTDPALWTLIGLGAVLVAALVGAIAAWTPTRAVVLAGFGPIAGYAMGAQYAFVRGTWLPLVQPMATVALATLVVLLYRYWLVDRDGRRIQHAFQHYMAPEQVALLASHPDRLRLGGEARTMTLMFCDIRGFTAISEQFKSDPQGLTRLINAFLTPMTNVIMSRRGTIDKYMGDCIMAFWNAPLEDAGHADHACASALAMLVELEALNERLAASAAREGRPFHRLAIGIGLNSGDCVVGNMGSDRRFDYSVLGDAVNLASRLEGQSKTYGVGVVLGEATRALAHGYAMLELDRIAVKGKQEAVRIYTLLGDATVAQSTAFADLTAHHDTMLARYRAQDWDGAERALAACRELDERLAALYALYAERIAYYRANPPGADWDGVFVATSK